jgi:hypothetical protein
LHKAAKSASAPKAIIYIQFVLIVVHCLTAYNKLPAVDFQNQKTVD